MASTRKFELGIVQMVVPTPCFFPSVSSVKTNLMPVDYVELLNAAQHPLFLVSAYDIDNASTESRTRLNTALNNSKNRGAAILMDSGNYEAFWKGDSTWVTGRFHKVLKDSAHDLCFCYDNQEPPSVPQAIAEDVVSSVLRDQEHSSGTVAPIVHGEQGLLALAAQQTAKKLYPVMLAVPERALGEGIVTRIHTVRRIRAALDDLGFYCPLHLLGTGNPLSIITYAMAGADSFDGLEWCQTVVDHDTGKLFHFQQWDLFRHQTDWGGNNALPFIQSALMHNLVFYGKFMNDLHEALIRNEASDFLKCFASKSQSELLLKAINANN